MTRGVAISSVAMRPLVPASARFERKDSELLSFAIAY